LKFPFEVPRGSLEDRKNPGPGRGVSASGSGGGVPAGGGFLGAVHNRLYEGDAPHAIADLGHMLADGARGAVGTAGAQDFGESGIQVGKCLQVALGVPRWGGTANQRRFVEVGRPPAQDAGVAIQQRKAQFVGLLLKPLQCAPFTENPQPQPVSAAGGYLRAPQQPPSSSTRPCTTGKASASKLSSASPVTKPHRW